MFKPKFYCVVPYDFIGCFIVKLVAVPRHIHFGFVMTEIFLLVNLDWNDSVCGHYNIGLITTKPVFGVSDKVSFKPVFLATGTNKKIEISPVVSYYMILSTKGITKALIRLRVYAGWSVPLLFTNPRRQVFLR